MSVDPLHAAEKYTYRVVWSEADQQYVGVCSEFVALSHPAASHDEALAGIVAAVRSALDALRLAKQAAPEPSGLRFGRLADRGRRVW